MTGREYVNQQADEYDLPLLTCDGMDDAIVGVAKFWGSKSNPTIAVAYDYDEYIAGLVGEGMTEDEAIEYFEFNVAGAYVGDHTPVFITLTPAEPAEPIDTITQPG